VNDLLQVAPAIRPGLPQGFLHRRAVEGKDVDEVWEVADQPDQAHDVGDLLGLQPIEVVEQDHDGQLESLELLAQPLCLEARGGFPVAGERAAGARRHFAADPGELADDGQVAKGRDDSPVAAQRLGDPLGVQQSRYFQLTRELGEEVVDQLFRAGEEPGVEANDGGHVLLAQLVVEHPQNRALAAAPGPGQSDDEAGFGWSGADVVGQGRDEASASEFIPADG
jgi:hypothetical protein